MSTHWPWDPKRQAWKGAANGVVDDGAAYREVGTQVGTDAVDPVLAPKQDEILTEAGEFLDIVDMEIVGIRGNEPSACVVGQTSGHEDLLSQAAHVSLLATLTARIEWPWRGILEGGAHGRP